MVIKKILFTLSCLTVFTVQASPDIQHWQTANGARVYFVQAMELPMVDVQLVFDAGSARDNGKPGVALLTKGMLAEGAGGDSAQTLAEKFEAVGAAFSNSAHRDMSVISLRSLRDDHYLQPALANLKNIIVHPDFPQQAFKRELERLKIAVQARKQSPGDIAEEAFMKAVYGDHPYASPTEGTEASLQAMTLKDIKAHYRTYYVARNAVLAIVGQMDRSQAEQLANQLLGDLPAGEKAADLPEVIFPSEARTIRIEYPSQQTHILVGQPGVRRMDRDYFTLYVANHPFGGSGFASRLMDEVREKRGLAYSVYSYFMPMREYGPFQMGLQTRNDQTQQALDIVTAELQRYVKEGPTDKELDASIRNITGGFPLRIDSNRKIVEYLAMIGFYQLPMDYLDSFSSNIKSVDAAKIRDALQRRVHPNSLITVIVGASG